MNSFDDQLRQALAARHSAGLWRRRPVLHGPQTPVALVDGRPCLSFCSNDYLGLANHPQVVQAMQQAAQRYGVGSGASHLVSGHSLPHQALEEELADFCGRPRALLFGSGYQANVGVLTALAGKGDLVLEDRLNHASLLDGGLFSGARFRRYAHGDAARLRALLDEDEAQGGTGRCFVVSDGVFSMDGDLAPLPALVAAARGRALLLLDDAHGFGVLGREGGGTLAHFREQGSALSAADCPILIGTLGKAFGTAGAFVTGSEALVEFLIQFCRHYIYTTALPAALAEASRVSLRLLRAEQWRRDRLQDYVRRFRDLALAAGYTLTPSQSPIQGLLLGSADRAVEASRLLRERGLHVGAIRPPTVPEGSARLRVTFSAAHEEAQFQSLLDALEGLAPVLNREEGA